MLRESFLIVGEACPGGAVVIVTSCARQLLMVTFAQFAIACSLSRQLYENFLSIYIIVSGILFHLIPSEVTAGRRRCVCVLARFVAKFLAVFIGGKLSCFFRLFKWREDANRFGKLGL